MPPIIASQPVPVAFFEIDQNNSCFFAGTLIDDATGSAIPLVGVSTIQLTLYNLANLTVISQRNIKNTGGGTYAFTSGEFTLRLVGADNGIVDVSATEIGERELHIALLEFGFLDGGAWRAEIHVSVRRIRIFP